MRESGGERGTLSARDLQVLEFERRDWPSPGAKELAVRSELGLSAARYAQLVNGLLDSPAALVHDPMLIGRLRRLREARVAARSSFSFPHARGA